VVDGIVRNVEFHEQYQNPVVVDGTAQNVNLRKQWLLK